MSVRAPEKHSDSVLPSCSRSLMVLLSVMYAFTVRKSTSVISTCGERTDKVRTIGTQTRSA